MSERIHRGPTLASPRVLLGPALALALATSSSRAHAEDTSELEGLLEQPVVATASRVAESSADAPAVSSTISAEELHRYGIRSLAEAINFLSLGMVTQNPLHSTEIGSRGVLLSADFGNHVLLLVDGHAMNELWNGTAYFEQGAAIPLELVDHIEVILGPGSVLYGSNAMLGVINVVTKRAKDYDGYHAIVEAGLSPSVTRDGAIGSFGDGRQGETYRVGAGLGRRLVVLGHDVEATFHVEYYTQSGPTFQFGPQQLADDPTKNYGRASPIGVWGGATRQSYYTRVPAAYGRVVVGDFELALRAAAYKRATPYVNNFNQTVGDFDDPGSYELDRWLSFDAQYHKRLSESLRVMGRLYGDTYDYQQRLRTSAPDDCPVLPGDRPCLVQNLGISRWMGAELQSTIGSSAFSALLGTDARVRQVGGKNDGLDADTGSSMGTAQAYTHTEGLIAGYAQGRAVFTRWLSTNTGARLDYGGRVGSHLSPRVAVVLQPHKDTSIKVIYAEAFRTPTAYELYYEHPGIQLAGASLRPEIVRSLEASVEQRLASQRVLVGVFRSWWQDMVALGIVDERQGLVQYQNVSGIDNYGLNAAYSGSWRSLRYGATVTAAVARRDGSQPLTVAPAVFGNGHVSYAFTDNGPVLGVAAALVGPRYADRAFDGGFTPQPRVSSQWNVRGTLTGPVPGVAWLSYRLIVDWVSPGRSPYTAGPVQAASQSAVPSDGAPVAAELAPINRLTLLAGLRMDLVP